MTFENQQITFDEALRYERTFRDKDKYGPWSHCIARAYNGDYCATFAIWRNDYGRCYEVGLRNLKTDKFELNFQGNFPACFRRYHRLSRLIEAGRELKI